MRGLLASTVALALLSVLRLPNQQVFAAPEPPPNSASSPLTLPAKTWAQQCGVREAQLIDHNDSYLRYRMHVVDEKGDQIRDQIETPDGSVARLILLNGQPLTPEQDQAERGRLNFLLTSPTSFAHHIKNEQSNKKLGTDLLKLMPDAMLWSYAPGQPPPPDSVAGNSARQLIVLDFKPNPSWSPPNLPADALTGLAGRIWIDAATSEMVHLEGALIRPVNVGWGMVVHLYPGGRVTLSQTRVTDDRWIVDHIDEQLVLRALMVKTIRQHLVYNTSDYRPIPVMTYQQAIKTLLDTPLPTR